MHFKNLFKKKQDFTRKFASLTVTRRGYEHEKSYRWKGKATLFGIESEIFVEVQNEEEFLKAEKEFLLAKENEQEIFSSMQKDLKSRKIDPEFLHPIKDSGSMDVCHDHVTIGYSSEKAGYSVYSTMSEGIHCIAEVMKD